MVGDPLSQRTKAERDGDRATIIAALEEAGGPLRIDELLRDAWGVTQDHVDEQRMRLDLKALVRAHQVVEAWPSQTSPFLTYRLATPEDLDVETDELEVRRLLNSWEAADGGQSMAYWDGVL